MNSFWKHTILKRISNLFKHKLYYIFSVYNATFKIFLYSVTAG